jgi:hypothetical protein
MVSSVTTVTSPSPGAVKGDGAATLEEAEDALAGCRRE